MTLPDSKFGTVDVMSVLPSKKAFELKVVPLKISGSILYIGIEDKNNKAIINDLGFYTGYRIIPEELSSEMIHKQLKEIYGESILGEIEEKQHENVVTEFSNVDFVNQIINSAIKKQASDIHIECYESGCRIRYRVDGYLREVLNLQKTKINPVISRIKIMANLDISEKRRPQDGKISYEYNEKLIDIRVSTLPTGFGEKIVLRILDKSQVMLDLNGLGFNRIQNDMFESKIKMPYGMILVTGPTGSGKTTTLYSALKEINSVEKNILTIEDPIEYNLDGINQSAVKPDIGYDFANALRSFLRQDPDVIMVGEIRDKETAEIAIRASLTGHLVFSTLHTNDSVSAITRLIDMGIEPFLVASSLRLIIAQRLVRKLCECKTRTETGYVKKGCDMCGNSGYKGRMAIFELLEITEEMSEMISKNSSSSDIKIKAKNNGFVTLRDAGLEKISDGITTNEEVWRETML